MSSVNVTVTTANITASSTNANITVGTTTSNVTVSNVASLANSNVVRQAISVTDTGGDGSLSYNSGTGVITYTGPSATEVRAHLSNTSPVTYNASTGVIGVDSNAVFTGKTTDDLPQGTSNIYFSTSGAAVNTDNLTEGSTNLYFTVTNADNWLGTRTTNNLAEGSGAPNNNLYFTTARANAAMAAYTGGLTNVQQVVASTRIRAEGISGSGANVETTFGNITTEFGNITITDGTGIFEGNGYGLTNVLASNIVDDNGSFFSNAKVKSALILTGVEPNTGGGNLNGAEIMKDQWFRVGALDLTQGAGTAGNIYGVQRIENNNGRDIDFISGNTTQIGTVNPSGAGAFNFKYFRDSAQRSQLVMDEGDTTITVGYLGRSGDTSFVLNANTNVEKMRVRSNGQMIIGSIGDTLELLGSTNIGTTGSPGNLAVGNNVSAVHGSFTGATSLTATGNVSIGGNLDVTGNINSETVVDLFVEDRNITLQYGTVGAPSANSQVFVDRGSSANTYIKWDEGSDSWKFSNDGSTEYNIPTSTSDLAEGTNLYYTSARTDADIADYTGTMESLTGGLPSLSGNVTTTANVQGAYIIGDGSQLTNVTSDTISEQVVTTVYNDSGSTLNKGDAVYLTGVNTGDNPHVALADADNATKMPALGIVKENISNNSTGEVVTSGTMNDSSHGYTRGADLYISTTAGELTTTKPTGEASQIQKIGKAISLNHILVQGAFRSNDTPNLNEGNIFLGDTNNQAKTVTPDTNFTTTGNAFSLSNSLTDVNDITSETSSDIQLKAYGNTKVNTFIDGNATEGMTMVPSGRAIKSTASYRGPNASYTRTGTDVYNGIAIAGTALSSAFGRQAKIVFTAGSNVVQIYGGYNDNWAAFTESTSIANTYQNGMVLMNISEISDYQSYTYPLSPKAHTVGLANSTLSYQYFYAGGGNPSFDAYDANVIMSEVSPVDFTWNSGSSSDRGIGMWHTLANSDGDQLMFSNYLGGSYPIGGSGGGNIMSYIPTDKNNFIVSDNGNVENYSSYTAGSLANVSTPLSYSDIAIGTGFPSSTGFRSTKQTTLVPTQGSAKFANIVLIGNNAQYDDTMAGHIYYPSFGINAVWDGVQDLEADTNPDFGALGAPISTGLRFKQFTDKTAQDPTSSVTGELSTAGARMLLGTANSNVTTSEATHRPITNQGIGVYGFFGSSEQEVAPRTRSLLPAGMFAVASETWVANTGTDMYFVSTPQGKKGIDTDDNEAHGFLASQNGETSLFGTSKVSFFQSGNAYSSGNIVGGFNALKSGTEWANISSTGIQTTGSVVAKAYTGTVVDIGTRSGDISSTVDINNGNIYKLEAVGDITLNSIANAVAGSSIRIIIKQDGTGSRLLTSSMKFAGGDKTLSTGGGSIDIIDIFYDGTNYFAELTKAYA